MKHYNPHHIERLQALEGKPLAAFWQRGVAFGIDCFVGLICTLATLIIVRVSEGRLTVSWTGIEGDLMFDTEFINLLLELIAPVLYFGLLTYITQGKTVGKWIMGIKVVPITHDRISLLHSVERAMAYATSIAEFGFGFANFFMNHNRRTLGDKVGETIVIRDRVGHKEKLKAKEKVDLQELIMAESEAEPEIVKNEAGLGPIPDLA
jgi:uncharacterized RDD family membrane protein YckC